MPFDFPLLRHCIACGVSGVIYKSDSVPSRIEAIHTVYARGVWIKHPGLNPWECCQKRSFLSALKVYTCLPMFIAVYE
jgi:hypothetical protein